MSFRSKLVAQFHRPAGLLGYVAGWVMANRESNLARNAWTVGLAEIRAGDTVLELGPGPGVTLGLLLTRASAGQVVAVDHSALMLRQCRQRHARAVREGRLKLVLSSFTALPEMLERFDRIIAVNSLQFDALSPDHLTEIVARLKPGGLIAITFQPRGANPTDEQAMAFAKKTSDLLCEVGAVKIRIEQLAMEPVSAFCVLGQRSV